jgi:metal-responsive CopG/Arc/MetJ family transcriptional regulator
MTELKNLQFLIDNNKQKINIEISKSMLIDLDEYIKSQGLSNRKRFIELLIYRFIYENKNIL